MVKAPVHFRMFADNANLRGGQANLSLSYSEKRRCEHNDAIAGHYPPSNEPGNGIWPGGPSCHGQNVAAPDVPSASQDNAQSTTFFNQDLGETYFTQDLPPDHMDSLGFDSEIPGTACDGVFLRGKKGIFIPKYKPY